VSAGLALTTALAAEHDAYVALLRGEPAGQALTTARDAYLASHEQTGPQSWGRLVGALKLAILAGDGVEPIARRALDETEGAPGPAASYARALGQVALGQRPEVGPLLQAGDAFERTGRALASLAAGDGKGYRAALREILADFEARGSFLSGVPIADTVMVLEALAEPRGVADHPHSALLPAGR
jgi:hypothetical protein